MKASSLIVSGLLFASSGDLLAADASAQAGGSAQQNTSVKADQTGAGASHGNAASASTTSDHAQTQLAEGSEINATLSKPVDSRKDKPGDPVTATTTRDTRSNGEVIIPRNSKLLGHVTETRNRGDAPAGNDAKAAGSAESALGIVFDEAVLKDGRRVPINGAIQAIAATSSTAEGEMHGPASIPGPGAGGGGSGSASGGGLLGSTAGNLTGTVGGAVNATGGATAALTRSPGAMGGLNSAGRLGSGSHGVFGLDGYSLTSAAGGAADGSLITSAGRNVRLDSGTQLLLVSGAKTSGNVAKSASQAPASSQKPTDKN